MPDPRRQDAALAAATTVWSAARAWVLPLTVAVGAVHGARLFDRDPRPQLGWTVEPLDGTAPA